MTIERIYTRAQPGGPTVPRLRARLAKGQGIEGDRYFGIVEEPSVNVTLIEAEAIEALLGELGLAVDFSITGRNLVTRGVQLNRWVGRDFMAGPVRLRGVELAEPCLTLGSAIAQRLAGAATPADIVRRFVHRAGLRAQVLGDGEIRVGDALLESL
jgi:MOSC domain-containing protein YiiM